ncbi:ATP-binding protein [Streptomyces sp. NPDC001795]|uniref:ATP-binding protein n=1 Tax=unclassified Streptomyces TaxID=2593676 RepID=UPI00331DA86F
MPASAVDRRPHHQKDLTRSMCQPIAGTVVSCQWTAATDQPTVHIRHPVAEALHALGFAQDGIDDVVLAASELAANATEHAEGPYCLLLHHAEPTYLLECYDHGSTLPPVGLPPAPRIDDSLLSELDPDAVLMQLGEQRASTAPPRRPVR